MSVGYADGRGYAYPPSTDAKARLTFANVAQAERVIKPYRIEDRLEALLAEGFDLAGRSHKEIGEFIGASRERVCLALGRIRAKLGQPSGAV